MSSCTAIVPCGSAAATTQGLGNANIIAGFSGLRRSRNAHTILIATRLLSGVVCSSLAGGAIIIGSHFPCCSSSDSSSSQNFCAPISAHHVTLNCTSAAYRHRICQKRRTIYSLEATSDDEVYLPDLQVPRAWVSPCVAAKEAEWLRGALQQWLDDEFCPEPANEEISRRCAKVYYYCLLEEQLDIGDILMQMVRELETFSFKQSFHGAFSSANAAIELITKRMRGMDASSN